MYICRKQPVLQYISISNSGSKPTNKDFFYEGERLFIVCDGVDGAPYGDVASKLACNSISEFFNAHYIDKADEMLLNDALKYTIQKFKETESLYPEIKGMSTTTVLIAFENDGAIIAWLGDSRAYHISDGKIQFVTTDHSLANELKNQECINENEVKNIKNFITKSLNAQCAHLLSLHKIPKEKICEGDYFMLCTDGALENITEEIIESECIGDKNIEELMNNLAIKCEGNTRDNYTLQIIKN
ncbi:MAG: serine/threonine-protein phosphatase [Bacteroidetes bacterium]|nr:serine/threonine-protein phosphatase [Bacteroidota bacterium]